MSPRRLLAYAWAAPVSLLALLPALLAHPGGGSWRWREGVLEVSGGWTGWLLQALPGCRIDAITLGHVVIAATPALLELTRRHERVHVAQYARWGFLFPPAYLLASLWAWLRGGSAYRDNCFEREAFSIHDPGCSPDAAPER